MKRDLRPGYALRNSKTRNWDIYAIGAKVIGAVDGDRVTRVLAEVGGSERANGDFVACILWADDHAGDPT